MAENRLDRELKGRDKEVRVQSWRQPDTLPEPRPEKGYTFRWVRISSHGSTDATNISSKLRQGWVPVKASDHPEITMVAIENEKFSDNIVIGGLLLCKVPEEIMNQRREYYEELTASQMRAVDSNFMRESDPRMPLFSERKSKRTNSFGSGD